MLQDNIKRLKMLMENYQKMLGNNDDGKGEFIFGRGGEYSDNSRYTPDATTLNERPKD